MPNKDAVLPQGRTAAFQALYEKKLLGAHETISGAGSRLMNTARLRKALERLLATGFVSSILDVGCGDFNWLSAVSMPGIDYLGVDIVPELIEENRKRWPGFAFQVCDIVESVPSGFDLVLCKDVFSHLPRGDIVDAFNNIKSSGAHYIALTNFHPEDHKEKTKAGIYKMLNQDSRAGYWRPVNMQAAPYFFPLPLVALPEQQLAKTLDIWALSDLPFLEHSRAS